MINSKIKMTGHIVAKCYDQSVLSTEDLAYNKKLVAAGGDRSSMKLGKLKWGDDRYNLISEVGFEVFGNALVNGAAAIGDGKITHMALGTSTTAPNSNDIKLGTEVYRNATASGAVLGNVTDLTAFFSEAEVSGTFEEFGTFIDATGVADSGILFTHVLTGGWTKSLTEALVISITYTMTSS